MKPLVLLLLLALALPGRAQFFDFQNPAFIGALGGTGSSGAGGGSAVDNNVAHDSFVEFLSFTTVVSAVRTLTNVSTLKGIGCMIAHGTEATDLIGGVIASNVNGTVTLARITNITDAATEPGASYMYFAGASIPAGNLDFHISCTSGATIKDAIAFGVTSDAATTTISTAAQVAAQGGDLANPQLTIDTGADSALCYSMLYTGLVNPANATILANMTAMEMGDNGNFGYRGDRETSDTSGSRAIGYTAAGDDAAHCVFAIK